MSSRTNRRDKARIEIERRWGDVPVVDAKADLRVIASPEDLVNAVAKDPGHCFMARACMRLFGASKVAFYRRTAFIELPDEVGQRRVERFLLGQTVRDLIESFDRGEPIIPDAGFRLLAPPPSRTLEASRRQNRTMAARKRSREKHRREREKARAERAAKADLGDDAAGPEPPAPPEEPRKPLSKYAPFRDEALFMDAKSRSGAGVVNWIRKKASLTASPASARGTRK